jgi:hypothetical protein
VNCLNMHRIPLQLFIIAIAMLWGLDARASIIIQAPNYLGLESGLVGFWSFDGKDMADGADNVVAYDRSGQGNTGTLIDTATSSVRTIGKIGQALDFDGSDDYVGIGAAVVTAYPFTMCAWGKADVLLSNAVIVSLMDNTDPAQRHFIEIRSADISAVSSSGGTSGSVATGFAPNADQWYHVCAVFAAANNRKLFVDGVSEDTDTTSVTPAAPNDTEIGRLGDSTPCCNFDGLIDDVRIYNRALLPTEIRRLYRIGGTFKINKPNNTGLTNGLVGYWSFDGKDMDATRAIDRSGQTNHGTLTGTTRAIGRIGQGLDFDGVDDTVNAGSDAELDNLDPYTEMAWIYLRSFPTSDEYVITNKPSTQFCNVDNRGGSNGVQALRLDHSRSGANTSIISADNTLSLNTWYHVVCLFDSNGTSKIYINGEEPTLDTNTQGTGGIGANASGSYIVGSRTGTSDFFDGFIDDVRIYNRVLTEQEIRRLYRLGGTFKIDTRYPADLSDGLVGYYTFEVGKGGATAYDSSVNFNHGTLTSLDSFTSWVDSKKRSMGGAIDFDGTGYVIYDTSSPVVAYPVSMCAWFKADTLPGNNTYAVIIMIGDDGSTGGNPTDVISLHIAESGTGPLGDSNHIVAMDRDTTDSRTGEAETSFAATAGVWTHACGVFVSVTERSLYVNSVLEVTNTEDTSPDGGLTSTADRVVIGNWIQSSGGNDPFDGLIDEVRIYNRSLSAAEIKRLYEKGR